MLNISGSSVYEMYVALRLGEDEKPITEKGWTPDFSVADLPPLEPWGAYDEPVTPNQLTTIYRNIEQIFNPETWEEWKDFARHLSSKQAHNFMNILFKFNREPSEKQINTVKSYIEQPWQGYREECERSNYTQLDKFELSDLIGRLKRLEETRKPITKKQYNRIISLWKQACGYEIEINKNREEVAKLNGKMTKRCLAELDQESAEGVIFMYERFIEEQKLVNERNNWEDHIYANHIDGMNEQNKKRERKSNGNYSDKWQGTICGIEGLDGQFVGVKKEEQRDPYFDRLEERMNRWK